MVAFLAVVTEFVTGFFSLELPIGVTVWQLTLGLWVLYALGDFIFGLLRGDD